mgnify:CR=1 FL=1
MEKINHGERDHALLSPSSSKRWLNCPPSARLAESVENKSSVYADEGTLAHEIAQNALELWDRDLYYPEIDELPVPDDLAKSPYFSEDMVRHVGSYVDFVVNEFHAMHKEETGDNVIGYWEATFDLSKYIPESFGSSDATLLSPTILHVIDLKYGAGVKVSAQSNTQLMIYALGMLNTIPEAQRGDIKEVRMSIVQPRLDHYDTLTMSANDLLVWGEKVLKPKAKVAWEGGGEQKIGDHCQFCPLKAQCRAQYDAITSDFDEECEPLLMTDEEIVEMIGKIDRYRSWINSFDQFVYQEAMNGKKWTGYKLVEGRSSRKITDPDKVRNELLDEYLEDEIMNISLKGITDLEKLLGKKVFAARFGKYLQSQPGAPKLVPESHPGTEYNSLSDFDVES